MRYVKLLLVQAQRPAQLCREMVIELLKYRKEFHEEVAGCVLAASDIRGKANSAAYLAIKGWRIWAWNEIHGL